MPDDKIEIENINTPGRTERVNRAKYQAMRDALMAVLPHTASLTVTPDPVFPDDLATFEVTVTNPNSSGSGQDLTSGAFSLSLSGSISGMTMSSPAQTDFCGTGSSLNGTSSLLVSGLAVPAGSSCTFSWTATVPAATADGTYGFAPS